MTDRQIKWLILVVPSVAIGLWEFIRHEFHIPHLTMELGNWLAPFLVLGATLSISLPLFRMLESSQRQLQEARELQSALMERERIARELHDGIAQSLFLLSVKADQLETGAGGAQAAESIRQTAHQVNGYVRQAIANLRFAPETQALPWTEMLHRLFEDVRQQTELLVDVDWRLPEERLSVREKVELYACLREALTNAQKHAGATRVSVESRAEPDGGWRCDVADDGRGWEAGDGRAAAAAPAAPPTDREIGGFGEISPPDDVRGKTGEAAAAGIAADAAADETPFPENPGPGRYGLKIVRERAAEMHWTFALTRVGERTIFTIRKEGSGDVHDNGDTHSPAHRRRP